MPGCKSIFPKNQFNFLRWRSVIGGTLADLPDIELCDIELVLPAPTNLVATALTGSRINLSWDDNSSGEINFEIERSLTSGSGFSLVATVGANVTTYQDTGLANGTQYFYRVRAVSGINSDYSNEDDATTFIPFVMQVNTSISATSGSNQFILPFLTGGLSNYNCTVEWGDGNLDTITDGLDAAVIHTYNSPGTYTIEISGNVGEIDGFNFSTAIQGNDGNKVTEISRFANIRPITGNSAFLNCANMELTTTDPINLSLTTSTNNWFSGCSIMTASTADLSGWDMSGITDMQNMFRNAFEFNGNVGSWDVSSTTTLASTFSNCRKFNQNIDSWDITSCLSLAGTFQFCFEFNQPLNSWNTTTVTNMFATFNQAEVFNQPLNNWDTSNVTSMQTMFDRAFVFNQNITGWDVSNVSNFIRMFEEADAFNQPIGSWDMSGATTLQQMFKGANVFNQPLDAWNVSGVTNMQTMFNNCPAFNQDLNSWVTTSVTNMNSLFNNATAFNGNISSWDTSNVENMGGMFRLTPFNGNITGWDVSSVTDFNSMFSSNLVFNQNISGWNTSAATDMNNMFNNAQAFDQNLGSWDITGVTDMTIMFLNSGLTTANYDPILTGWEAQSVQNNINVHFGSAQYSAGAPAAARAALIADHSWVIADGGPV